MFIFHRSKYEEMFFKIYFKIDIYDLINITYKSLDIV